VSRHPAARFLAIERGAQQELNVNDIESEQLSLSDVEQINGCFFNASKMANFKLSLSHYSFGHIAYAANYVKVSRTQKQQGVQGQ